MIEQQLRQTYEGTTVFVTGHTGFKGSWLTSWLLHLGAKVVGVALPPESEPALFDELSLSEQIEHNVIDIRERDQVIEIVSSTKPDFLFHLAAQPLVRRSYSQPVLTFETNVLGTVNILEGLRTITDSVCHAVFITTDKCYANQEWLYGYRETDPLGGHDPYSASKACAELAIESYRKSFFSNRDRTWKTGVSISSARAGNVIGGGDWATDRIVPDAMRALSASQSILVRNPDATRPWQHVLEPLYGYLLLGSKQKDAWNQKNGSSLDALCSAFNFGPMTTSNRTVEDLVTEVVSYWPGSWKRQEEIQSVHEAGKLHLSSDKAYHLLGWSPSWDFAKTVEKTTEWYRSHCDGGDPVTLVRQDVQAYMTSVELR